MCPTCGAIYNVAGKDIGRRIKCKKCGTSLEVREGGLEIEDANAPPAPVSASKPAEIDDEPEAPRRKRDRERDRRSSGPAINPMELLAKIGGIPTILFAFGAFLVIVFLFMPIIGTAAVDRAQGAAERVDLQWKAKERELTREKKTGEEIQKAREEFYKKRDKEALDEDVLAEKISNKRSRWFELYGMMFGFLLVAFGCLGYLLGDFGIVLRIVAAVVLLFMVMAAFKAVVGTGAGANIGLNLG